MHTIFIEGLIDPEGLRRQLMTSFFKTVLHATLGGFLAGIGGVAGGAHLKSILLAGAGAAGAAVISLWTKSPTQN